MKGAFLETRATRSDAVGVEYQALTTELCF